MSTEIISARYETLAIVVGVFRCVADQRGAEEFEVGCGDCCDDRAAEGMAEEDGRWD